MLELLRFRFHGPCQTPAYFPGTFSSCQRAAISIPRAATSQSLPCTKRSLFCISQNGNAFFSITSRLFCSLQGVWGIRFFYQRQFPSSYDVMPSNPFLFRSLRTLSCATDGVHPDSQFSSNISVRPRFVFRFSDFKTDFRVSSFPPPPVQSPPHFGGAHEL